MKGLNAAWNGINSSFNSPLMLKAMLTKTEWKKLVNFLAGHCNNKHLKRNNTSIKNGNNPKRKRFNILSHYFQEEILQVLTTNQWFRKKSPNHWASAEKESPWLRRAEHHNLQMRVTRRNKWINKNQVVGVMCCLPSHALPVLCPSGLLSRSGSACQLTTDGHVLTPSTFNQIIWWQHLPRNHRQLDTLILQHKRSLRIT